MRARTAIGAAAIGLVVGGCLPSPATSQARAVADLWTVFLVAAAAVGLLVWGLITFAIFRYRRRASDVPGEPPRSEFRHALPLEIAWTTGPILIVLFLFVMTLLALQRIDAHEGGAVTVHVEAFRWQWRFDYEGSGVTVTGTREAPAEMVVPVGEPVHVLLTSDDVITRSTCRPSCSSGTPSRATRPSSTSRSMSRAGTAGSAPSSAASTTTECCSRSGRSRGPSSSRGWRVTRRRRDRRPVCGIAGRSALAASPAPAASPSPAPSAAS